MREMRLLGIADIDAYTDIAYNAYPNFKDTSEEGLRAYKANLRDVMENDDDVFVYGLFEGKTLIAVMRIFLFRMNYCGTMVTATGLGYVGVHLLHKKKGAAQELIAFYERFSRERGANICLLLPFRPDYYKKSGYGFGTKWNEYRIGTEQIPPRTDMGRMEYLPKSDLSLLYNCHARVAAQTHGMVMRIRDEKKTLESNERWKIVVNFGDDGTVDGYLVFEFVSGKAGNYTINHMYVREMIYKNHETLLRLLEFIRRQRDQVQMVVFGTGEEAFHYLFDNPLDDSSHYALYGNLQTNTQFIGVMYKILNAAAFAASHGQVLGRAPLAIRFSIVDRVGKEERTGEEFLLQLHDGVAGAVPVTTVAVRMNRADFSSLFMGCVCPGGLYKMGCLDIDNPQMLSELDRVFAAVPKPICNTDF